MSGHNKWSKIKHKKAASDAKKSQEFSKLMKLVTSEAKKSGGNRESPSLKATIEKAKKANVPKENIERAIKKAEDQGSNLEAITYESYGPGGSAIIIEALTDNRNKAAAEIKHILSKHGYSLASPGSATWAFGKDITENLWQATSKIKLSEGDDEKLSDLVSDLEDNDEVQEVFTNAE